MEIVENGRIESIRQSILSMEPAIVSYPAEKSVDLFDSHMEEDYSIKNIRWLKKLQKQPFSADATVDLTMDTDDSDIEVELPLPVELIEVEDEPPLMMSTPKPAGDEGPSCQSVRIGIQERRDYIKALNDVRPLSFIALRRQSLLDDEKRKSTTTPLSKRRKSAHGRLFDEVLGKKQVGGSRKTRSKSVYYTNKLKSSPDPTKKLLKIVKAMPKCFVSIRKISNREIAQFRRGKLSLEYFERKFGVNKVTKSCSYKRKLPAKEKTSPKKRKLTKKAEISSNNNNSSYPDHTQPNISLLQVIVNDLSLQPSSSTHKNETITDISHEVTQNSSKSEEDPSIPIVNWPRVQIYSPLIDASSPSHEPISLDIVSTNLTINRAESFDAISDSEQNGTIETSVNKSLLEDILGDRANNYLPEVHASILSTLSRSSQSADESAELNSSNDKSCERRKSERRKSKKGK